VRVTVVGAGLAGLAAAHRLETLGCQVTVREAREAPGGKHRLVSVAGGEHAPWPALAPRVAPALAELLAELGLAAAVRLAPLERAFVLRGGVLAPLALELRAALGASPLAPFRLRRTAVLATWLGGALDPDAAWRDTRLDDRSAADFARTYLGARALERLVAPLHARAFGLDAAQASRRLLFSLLEPAGRIGLARVAGAGALAPALAAKLADLRLGAPVRRAEELDADAVVLATSSAEARRLAGALGPRESEAFARLAETPALVLALSTPNGVELPGDELWLPAREGGELAAIASAGGGLLQLVARPDLGRRHGHRPDAELAHFLLESAQRVVHPLASRHALGGRLHRVAAPAFAVGHYRALASLESALAARPDRRIFFAGDWCAGPHLEGELASGLAAASAVAARFAR